MTALQDVRDQLAAIKPAGVFATRRIRPAVDLRLNVKGIGPITLPISEGNTRRLAAIARPARYGLKDQTRFDSRIRDTGEIVKRLITIDQSRWDRTLRPVLDQVRHDLGLPDGVQLTAALHNLLVYEPGQFFTSHQDSEKTDDMVGTLVVILPAAFTGGAMVIEHHDARVTYRGSARQLTFVAFYADCHHEVRPIRTGHRVVLTYNLIAKGKASAIGTAVTDDQVHALGRSIQTYFESPHPPRWSSDSRRECPDRLVCLLDHQYTRRSLAWKRLKNTDATRAGALRAVARRMDCEIVLALADVHESWSCEDEYDTAGWYGRRGRRWHAEEPEDDDASRTSDLVDLLDSEVELRHWVPSDGRIEGISGHVDDDELCFTKPSNELEPFASEHEGYMGNWGNTVDRWYHRAAVVLWPRERTFVIRAKAAPRWAVDEIQHVLREGDVERARSLAGRLAPFWTEVAPREQSRGFFERTLDVAVGLDGPEVAATLLHPFTLERVTPRAAAKLVPLCEHHGFPWCETMLESWTSDKRGDPEGRRNAWTASLPDVCRAVCAGGSKEGFELAQWLVANRWDAIVKQWKMIGHQPNPSSIASAARRLSRPLLGLLESGLLAGDPERHADILRTVMAPETAYPVDGLVHLLRAAHERRSPRDVQKFSLSSVHAYCAQTLTALLLRPVRGPGDWSVATSLRCTCRLCGTLAEFLRAPARRQFEWPLAKDQRAHVHHIIDSHDLAVGHVTRRVGRPFTLVLTKTDALHQREAAQRTQWDRDLRWLTKTAPVF